MGLDWYITIYHRGYTRLRLVHPCLNHIAPMGLFPDANVKNSPPDGFVFVVFIVFLLRRDVLSSRVEGSTVLFCRKTGDSH